MGNEVEKGNEVEIVGVHTSSSWYLQRKLFIGKRGILTKISSGPGDGTVYAEMILHEKINNAREFCFYGVELKKIYHSTGEKLKEGTKFDETKLYGHPRFYELIEEIKRLHSKKNYNYAASGSPLSNFAQCEKFGIPAPYGCLVRMTDKDCRRVEVLLKGDVVGETIIDTSKDDSVYSLIFVILFEEFLKNENAKQIMQKFKEIKKLLEEGKGSGSTTFI